MKGISSRVFSSVLLTSGILGTAFLGEPLLNSGTIANASAPDAVKQHQQEVTARCLKTSGLQNPRPVGAIIPFPDDVGYDALLVRGNYPQPHMNNQVGQSLCLFNRKTRQAHISEADSLLSQQPNTYRSDRSRLQFTYPVGFVVGSKSPQQGNDRVVELVDIWSQRDYDAIQSKTPPSELPANVSVTVQQNSRRLPLKEWVLQNNQFVSPKNVRSLTVAGQQGITFNSTGLYEYENVVLPIPHSPNVIVVDLAKVGIAERDAVYRSAFQQVLSTLEFTAQ